MHGGVESSRPMATNQKTITNSVGGTCDSACDNDARRGAFSFEIEYSKLPVNHLWHSYPKLLKLCIIYQSHTTNHM